MPGPDYPQFDAELEQLWPFKRFPLLLDDGRTVVESSIIIEHLQLYHRGALRLIPDGPETALEVRFLDRFFDLYIHTPMQKLVGDSLRAAENRDQQGTKEARQMLDTAYRWLEPRLQNREWAAGSSFTLADCSAAPALFYADWAHPLGMQFPNIIAYRKRLLARPSFARAVDEARPYRSFFPLGAPDRD